jgi:hypothetical protein
VTGLKLLVDFLSAIVDLINRFDEGEDFESKKFEPEAIRKEIKFKSLIKRNAWVAKKQIMTHGKPLLKRRLSAVALYLGFGVSIDYIVYPACLIYYFYLKVSIFSFDYHRFCL